MQGKTFFAVAGVALLVVVVGLWANAQFDVIGQPVKK